MTALRSLLYEAVFNIATMLWVIAGFVASPFAHRRTLDLVRGWAGFHHWLVHHLLNIEIRVEGSFPAGSYVFAVKHQSMLETLEVLRLTDLPVLVIKKELADLPLFGRMTRRYGIIAVERTAGAKALRALVTEGREAVSGGRSVAIYPEGTRVPAGQAPPLKSGFAALYRSLGMPVVPVATDSGLLWGRGLIHRPGTVTIRVGEIIPPGLGREDIERRVHSAINALELAPEASP